MYAERREENEEVTNTRNEGSEKGRNIEMAREQAITFKRETDRARDSKRERKRERGFTPDFPVFVITPDLC